MSSQYVASTQVAASVPFDNSTDGYVATNVQAAIEEAGKHLAAIEVSDTANATTTSGTDALLTGMSITATPGQYIVWFTGAININAAGNIATVSLYNNGVRDTSTVRAISPFDGGALSALSASGIAAIQRTVVVTAGSIQIEWNVNGGTATCGPRTLTMLRIG